MSTPVELVIAGVLENLGEVQSAVEAFAETEGLSSQSAYALSLCLEELLTNIVMHGRPPEDGQTQISISLARKGEEVLVGIEDDGSAYDPTATPDPDLDALLEDRPIGGLGIHLVRSLALRFDYAHREGKNRVAIALPRKAGTAEDAAP
ncbi:MAG: ATP-binding protein [Rhodospirillales bacterium]